LRSATNREVLAWSLPFCFGSLHLASGDLRGDPSDDVGAGWGQAEPIDVVELCRRGMVAGGGLRGAAVEPGDKTV
jgi:hypothetical protein